MSGTTSVGDIFLCYILDISFLVMNSIDRFELSSNVQETRDYAGGWRRFVLEIFIFFSAPSFYF